MISPWVALAWLGWRFQAAVRAIAGKHSAPATIELLPATFDEVPAFARACSEVVALGFETVGDYEVRTAIGPHTRQRTILRAFLAADRSAFAAVYELAGVTVRPGAKAGTQRVWIDFISRDGERSLTTSSGEPPLALHDPNPDRVVQRFPRAAVARLWDAHRRARGNSFSELCAADFAPRFTAAWTRGFEFQASRGLYERAGDRFVATRKLGLRTALGFHLRLRHRTGPRYLLTVVAAAAAFAFTASAADRSGFAFALPLVAALGGAVFAVGFKHFALPGVLAICALAVALDRDDLLAIAVFLVVLVQGALLLQRRRAAKAAARMAT